MMKSIFFLAIIFVLIPFFSFGEEIIRFENPLKYQTLEELVDAIINFLLLLSLAIAPLMVVVGAFNILTSGGDPKKVETGKNIIIYTIIGIIVIMFAKGAIAVIKSILFGSSKVGPLVEIKGRR
jgi:hypothetical protein